MPHSAKHWIGTAGWSYPDWEGVVYPRPVRGVRPLEFLSRFVNAFEVNSSFYRIPSPRMTAAWPRQVPADFRFAFKLTRTFTHERVEFPPQRESDAFLDALTPIRAAGLLGPLLVQFPWSFRYSADAVDWLARIAERFESATRFIEVRHTSWLAPEAQAALARSGGMCNIDQPRLRDCIGPSALVSGEAAYVRLHGRNAANWFAEGKPPFERYNYLYSDAELREWIARIDAMSAQAGEVYVFANNHYRGQAVANALELRAMLEGRRVDVPDGLLDVYPNLRTIAAPPREPGLFDAPSS